MDLRLVKIQSFEIFYIEYNFVCRMILKRWFR